MKHTCMHTHMGSVPISFVMLSCTVSVTKLMHWNLSLQEAFIHHVRETPPLEPFNVGDGFDLYIDGARFLPDNVTVTRVAARIFTSDFSQ